MYVNKVLISELTNQKNLNYLNSYAFILKKLGINTYKIFVNE